MKLFDSHTHIQFPVYDADRGEVISRARGAGVKMIVVGTQAESSAAALALAEKYPEDIWATAGFHPGHIGENWYHDRKEQKVPLQEKFNVEVLRKLAQHPKVVAIGECGLDYYRITQNVLHIKEEQKRVFMEQANLAQELGKPLMIHARASRRTDDAYEDAFQILSSLRAPSSGRGNLTPIFHFYSGSLAITKKLVDAGYYFTFGGVITFSRDYDEIIRYIPLERIMLETDAPYVAPAPYRGKRNEPAYVVEIAKKLAELTGKSFDEICQIATSNAMMVFGIE